MHSYIHSENESHSVMSDSLWPHELNRQWNSPGQNTGMGSLSLLQGIFPSQGSNPGLPPCKWILNQLSHQGSPRILEWVAYPLSSGSSQPRDQIGVSCIAGGFFTRWASREAQKYRVVSFPFSSGSSQPRNWTRVSCMAGRFFTIWTTRKALSETMYKKKENGKGKCNFVTIFILF